MKTKPNQVASRAKAELLAALSSSKPTNKNYVYDAKGNDFLCRGLFDGIKTKTSS